VYVSEPTTADGDGSPTPKRGAGKDQRKGLFARMALFLRQMVAELRKVIWPTRKELLTYTWVVLVFVVIMAGLIALFDLGLARIVFALFGE
jgi:preprotein translocase subunit SecE